MFDLQKDLIFDLGMYEGQDSRFYLDKGFRVVAIEAHPEYAAAGERKFAADIDTGRLSLLHLALWERSGETISFHTRGAQSSIFKEAVDRGGASVAVSVRTTTLGELFERFGVPYYLKCDLEGADEIVVSHLHAFITKPVFLSIETDQAAPIDDLARLGYDRFQIVNQAYHRETVAPLPAMEGKYVAAKMDVESSGLFGRELAADRWLTKTQVQQALKMRSSLVDPECNRLRRFFYRRFGRLTGRKWLIPTGWTDVHACHHTALL